MDTGVAVAAHRVEAQTRWCQGLVMLPTDSGFPTEVSTPASLFDSARRHSSRLTRTSTVLSENPVSSLLLSASDPGTASRSICLSDWQRRPAHLESRKLVCWPRVQGPKGRATPDRQVQQEYTREMGPIHRLCRSIHLGH